jgi:CRP-like cAMP-binding protein/RsiW-degrading membrane proteinase PrsW (M82 family)
MILVAYLIAVGIPALAAILIFTLDLFGTVRRSTVLMCIAWGVIGAFGLAYILNTATIDLLEAQGMTRREAFRGVVSPFTAPVLEEFLKAIILFYFISQPRFRYFVDGAVYGFAAGIGFAMSENMFYIYNNANDAALGLAISRVLSASLMHATASAVIGIALGLSRRSSPPQRYLIPLMGIAFGILVHLIYNNVLFRLEGSGIALLLSAIGIGVGGGILIAIFIGNGLESEKKRFNETLGLSSGVTSAERKAVQQLGSDAIEKILEDMEGMFGPDNATLIRQLFVIQANIGILKNNLKSPVGNRLKQAWESDIERLRKEMDDIRSILGTYIMTLLRSILDEDDDANWDNFSQSMTQYDPAHVHSFDVFINASRASNAISPEEIEAIANRIKTIAFFQNVDLADLDNLSRAISFRQYSNGQIIFSQGEEGDAMYLIDRGSINIFIKGEDGNEKLLRSFQSGDVVGEIALLDGGKRTASARAYGSLRVMILQRQHFNMFIKSRPQVIMAVLTFLAEKVRFTTDAVIGRQQNIQAQQLNDTDLEEFAALMRARRPKRERDTPSAGIYGQLAIALAQLDQQESQGERATRQVRATRRFN